MREVVKEKDKYVIKKVKKEGTKQEKRMDKAVNKPAKGSKY